MIWWRALRAPATGYLIGVIRVYVCNYRPEACPVEVQGRHYEFQPGPNWVDEPVPVQGEGLEVVESLQEVDWARVPEPWREGYLRQYGNIVWRERLIRHWRAQLRQWGESIRRMNKREGAEGPATEGPATEGPATEGPATKGGQRGRQRTRGT